MNLLLQRGQLREVAEQADGAGYFSGTAQDRRNGDAQLAQIVRGSEILDLFAAECSPLLKASGDEVREAGILAEHLSIAAVSERLDVEGGFRGRIGAGDQPCRIEQEQPGGHISRDRFAEAFGLLGALTF